MAQLIVPNLGYDVRDKLRDLARAHGRSVEDEAREILRDAVLGSASHQSGGPKLGSRLASRFAGLGLDQDIPELRGQPADRAACAVRACVTPRRQA